MIDYNNRTIKTPHHAYLKFFTLKGASSFPRNATGPVYSPPVIQNMIRRAKHGEGASRFDHGFSTFNVILIDEAQDINRYLLTACCSSLSQDVKDILT
jgi:hypothetical protein